MNEKETIIESLKNWVDGKSKHLDEFGFCIPDYSCCIPELKQPKPVREAVFEAFLAGDQKQLFDFYSIFFETLKQKAISITGEPKIFVNNQNGRISLRS
jgi:hypothetical protein